MALLLSVSSGHLWAASPEETVSFNKQIQPILSEYCYHCHGPDSATRKPKSNPLRLDQAQYAFEPRSDDKPVIVKGNPGESELLRRMQSSDEDEIMPPPSEHKTMKPDEIELVAKWIRQGAAYEEHWAFVAPVKSAVPNAGGDWAKNPIDRFIAQELEKQGLKPNRDEEASRLLRRLSFDLTGLPPAREELHTFLADKSHDAYEKVVDRMLASQTSAEHFARHWLDAVRYADTQGIHHDHSRSIWPYRDWVIAAFKENMPFDQFTIEQIAGDLLPESAEGQKIASGYNRLLPTTGEGGAIEDEYKAIYAKDRVDTTAAVWLGLTTGCASCHDHKFDPITIKDFYSLTAFFRNSTIRTLDDGNNANTPPLLFIPTDKDRARWRELPAALDQTQKALADRKKEGRPEFERWLTEASAVRSEQAPAIQPNLHFPFSDTHLAFQGTVEGKPVAWPGGNESHPGPFGPAPQITEVITPLEAESVNFSRDGKATYGAFLLIEDRPSGAVISRMDRADGFRGWDLFLSEGRPVVHIIDRFPDAALKVTSRESLKRGRWHHVMVVFDGAIPGSDAVALYIDGRKVAVDVNNNNLGPNITANVPFRLGARSDKGAPGDILKNGKVFLQDLRFYNRALSAADVAKLAVAGSVAEYLARPGEERKPEQKEELYSTYLLGYDESTQKLHAQMAQLRSEERAIRSRGATTLIMEENKETKPVAFILNRGNYASKGAEVGAATPEALPPMKPDAPKNRLGLARWIMSRDNPLTARVTVNRIWYYLFGAGIVETTEDFGVMGARPTHPELLDWLAVDFMESGWDFRRLLKTMVMSATYRQAASVSPEKLEKDPLNRLLSRGPRYRLDAEQIRDQALAASGLLVSKVGGPPVKPYQPEDVWEAVAMKVSNTRVYEQDQGEGLYRRSLYTFWKRIAPPPSMEILNAPSREVFCTRRERSNSPLQAFVTMNDPQFVEAARQLAAHALASSGDFDSRLDLISESLLARRLTTEEKNVVEKMQARALKSYENDPAAAEALLSVGESARDEKLPPAEWAAWTLVASQIMNLDESLTK